jgi:asparagine synthase (glutamine-hydrolysing)
MAAQSTGHFHTAPFRTYPDFQMAIVAVSILSSLFVERLADSQRLICILMIVRGHTDIRIKIDLRHVSMENGIAQGDRLSMANSVELRLPFVEQTRGAGYRVEKTQQKYPDYKHFPKPWLRGAIAELVPEWVLKRPKQGFAQPRMACETI